MKKLHTILTGATALLLGLGLAVPTAAAPFPFDDDDEEKSEKSEEAEDGEEAAEEDEETDEWFAVVGGDVYTGTGAVLRGATVLAKNGVIEEIGYEVELPEGVEALNATGMRVYPGLVALNATSRISRGLFAAQDDGQPVDPSLVEDEPEPKLPEAIDWLADAFDATIRGSSLPGDEGDGAVGRRPKRMDVEDGYDPFNPFLVLALSTGITSAEQSGSSIKLRRGTIDGVGMTEKYMATFSWSTRSPSSKSGTREKFESASRYLRELRTWEDQGKEGDEPSKKGVDANALKVLLGEVWARFNSNDRDELLGIARLAQQYRFRPVIYGAREGWTVADELGRAGAHVVLTPRTRADKDERFARPGGSSIENAAKLHGAGCTVVVVPASTSIDLSGIAGRDLLHLPIEAGFAVRGGLTNEAALQAITINPARLMGVDHRIGTLEEGKDCDLIVTDGDILHYQTFVQWSVVLGEVAYDKQEEIYFAHIRPRPELPDPVGGVLEDETSEEAAEEGEAPETDDDEGEEPEDEAGDDEGGDDDGGDDDGEKPKDDRA